MECKKRGVTVEVVVAAAALKSVADRAPEDTAEAQLSLLVGVDVARGTPRRAVSAGATRPVVFCAASGAAHGHGQPLLALQCVWHARRNRGR